MCAFVISLMEWLHVDGSGAAVWALLCAPGFKKRVMETREFRNKSRILQTRLYVVFMNTFNWLRLILMQIQVEKLA